MSNYTYQPDKFLVLRFEHKGEILYKVLGSWYGGYLSGDSWRLNSGITEVTVQGPFILFEGASGSVYKVHNEMYGANLTAYAVAEGWVSQSTDGMSASIMPEDTDWENLLTDQDCTQSDFGV